MKTTNSEVKPWGLATKPLLFADRYVSVARAVRGGYCSVHRHVRHSNQFLMTGGRLLVELYGLADEPTDQPRTRIVLGNNGRITVPAIVWHRFVALEESFLFECYEGFGTYDIDRRSEGGIYLQMELDTLARQLGASGETRA